MCGEPGPSPVENRDQFPDSRLKGRMQRTSVLKAAGRAMQATDSCPGAHYAGPGPPSLRPHCVAWSCEQPLHPGCPAGGWWGPGSRREGPGVLWIRPRLPDPQPWRVDLTIPGGPRSPCTWESIFCIPLPKRGCPGTGVCLLWCPLGYYVKESPGWLEIQMAYSDVLIRGLDAEWGALSLRLSQPRGSLPDTQVAPSSMTQAGAWQTGVGTHSVTVPPKPGNGPAHLEPTVLFSKVQGRAVCLWRGEARPE